MAVEGSYGFEFRENRECAFCDCTGNRFARGHRKFEQWHRCLPGGTRENGERMTPSSKQYFPELVVVREGPRPPITVPPTPTPMTTERSVRVCEELGVARRLDCATPHWACTDCGTKNLKALNDVAAVVRASGLPQYPEVFGADFAVLGADGLWSGQARKRLFDEVEKSVRIAEELGSLDDASAAQLLGNTRARLSLSVAAPAYQVAGTTRSWSSDQRGAIQDWTMFEPRYRLWAMPDTTAAALADGADAATVGGLILRWLRHGRDVDAVSQTVGRLASCSKSLRRQLLEETGRRRGAYFGRAKVLMVQLKDVTQKWERNLENRPQHYIRERNAIRNKYEKVLEAQHTLEDKLTEAEQQVRRERRIRRQAERRAGDIVEDVDFYELEAAYEITHTPLRTAKNGPYTREYRDAMVKDAVKHNSAFSHVIPRIIEHLEMRFPEEMKEYAKMAEKSTNLNHTVSKTVIEVDMMVFLDLVVKLAERKGFTPADVCKDGPADPTPMTWDNKYANFTGKGHDSEPACVTAASVLEKQRAAEFRAVSARGGSVVAADELTGLEELVGRVKGLMAKTKPACVWPFDKQGEILDPDDWLPDDAESDIGNVVSA